MECHGPGELISKMANAFSALLQGHARRKKSKKAKCHPIFFNQHIDTFSWIDHFSSLIQMSMFRPFRSRLFALTQVKVKSQKWQKSYDIFLMPKNIYQVIPVLYHHRPPCIVWKSITSEGSASCATPLDIKCASSTLLIKRFHFKLHTDLDLNP